MSLSDLGKTVEYFSNLCFNTRALEYHLSDRCFQTWCVEKQIIQVLFKYFNHLKLVQLFFLFFFNPGLVALLADMTGCCCGVGWWRTMKKLTTPSGPVSGSSHIPGLEDT